MKKIIRTCFTNILYLTKFFSRRGLSTFLNQQLSRIPSNATVLTIGSGGDVGNLLAEHQKTSGFYVVSLDIDPNRKPDVVNDVCSLSFDDESFDFIILAEVLEHVAAPQCAIDNLYRTLKSSGRLILTVPFLFPIHDAPYDYFRFTRHGLQLLFQKFKNVDIKEKCEWTFALASIVIRLFMEKSWPTKLLGLLALILAFLSIPLLIIVARFFPSTSIASGYVLTANKS